MIKAIALSGSVRKGSYNAALAHLVVDRLNAKGADAQYVDLSDFPMPLFDQDLEAKHHPASALELAEKFASADVIFISTPEYNGSISPLLKNTIDWISREKLPAYKNAIFAVGSVSPGLLGAVGARGHLRDILAHLGALIAPTSIGVGQAMDAINDQGVKTHVGITFVRFSGSRTTAPRRVIRFLWYFLDFYPDGNPRNYNYRDAGKTLMN